MGFNPLEELLLIHKRLTSAPDSALVSPSRVKAREALWSRSSDILSTNDALWIHVELPGTPQESIRLEGGVLTIRIPLKPADERSTRIDIE